MNEQILILHHDDADGFTAALIARRALAASNNPQIALRAVQYGDAAPELEDIRDQKVVIVDFSFPEATSDALSVTAQSLVVIDHHATSRWLTQKPYGYWDDAKCGALLTWEYFASEAEPPQFLRYIDIRDRWRFGTPDDLPHSREVSAAVASYPYETAEYLRWIWGGVALDDLIQEGTAILRYQERQIERLLPQAVIREFEGERIPFLNSAVFQSELGERLAQHAPFAVIWWEIPGKRVYSLRSAPRGADVSVIAKRHGGGGHPYAARFSEILN
jgi:uncharacterized protein